MSDTTKITLQRKLDTKEEFELYLKLKPYIGRCLAMNHELNNPLAVIMGYAEYLLEECNSISENQRKYIKNIIKCTEKIQKCVMELSEEKIALNEKIDLKEVTAFYKENKSD